MENSIMIGITELRVGVDSKQPLEERLKVAMRAALNHWLVTDEEGQFRMAVGAVMIEATEEERGRIETELKFLRGLSSAISGVPVDFGRLMEQLQKAKESHKLVGLKNLWDEVKAEK
ncbi:MAG: hypothetical protein ABSF21_00940 [Dehalococcoidia bacterium]